MYALFMSPSYLTFWKLHLNISLETPGDQRSASVIYSSSTRHNKNTTSEREVMNFFLVKTITEIYLLSNGMELTRCIMLSLLALIHRCTITLCVKQTYRRAMKKAWQCVSSFFTEHKTYMCLLAVIWKTGKKITQKLYRNIKQFWMRYY